MNTEIYDVVVKAVECVTRKQELVVTPKSRLISDLGMESVDTIELLFEIEERLGLSINLTEVFSSYRRAEGQSRQFDLELAELTEYLDRVR